MSIQARKTEAISIVCLPHNPIKLEASQDVGLNAGGEAWYYLDCLADVEYTFSADPEAAKPIFALFDSAGVKVKTSRTSSLNYTPTKTGRYYLGLARSLDGGAGEVQLRLTFANTAYSITYNLDGGSNHGDNPGSYTARSGEITLKPATKTGHTFDGWYDNGAFTGAAVTSIPSGSSGDKAYWAKWTINQYTVTFNGNGGIASQAATTVDYNTTVDSLPYATQTGKTFSGWNRNSDGTGEAFTTSTRVTADITVFALWDQITYSITFNVDGGSTVAGQTVNHGGKVSLPTAPTKTGYTFSGWYKEASCTNEWNFLTESVTDATILYAKWTANTYTLNYVANSGTGTTGATTATYPAKVIVAANNFTRSGYTFAGWNTQSDGNGTNYNVGAEFTFTEGGSTNLYAKWMNGTITGVTVPARDATPVSTISETSQYTGAVSWNPADNPFKGNTAYTATITLTAESGWTFTDVDSSSFNVTGSTSKSFVSKNSSTYIFKATFPKTTIQVGDLEYEGPTPIGVVFWVGTGADAGKYKIVALKDVGALKWSPEDNYYNFEANNSDSDGRKNHGAIRAACAEKGWTYNVTSFPAMYSCEYWDPVTDGGKVGDTATGWYLPAKDELDILYTDRVALNPKLTAAGGVVFASGLYWSSSQHSSSLNYSWIRNFVGGESNGALRVNPYSTRPIKAYSASLTTVICPALPLVAPKTGALPQTSIESFEYTGTVTWKLGGASEHSASTPFAANTVYIATVELTAKDGYTFTGVTENFFKVAGATARNSANSGIATVDFSATGEFSFGMDGIRRNGVLFAKTGEVSILAANTTVSGSDDYKIGANNGAFIADRSVALTPYIMGKYEVTQELYEAIMGYNPTGQTSGLPGGHTQTLRPVDRVTWFDAVEFCNKLSEKVGLTPVYSITAITRPVNSITSATVTLASGTPNGYRLPTEAEWEFAARGANPSAVSTDPWMYDYAGSETITDVAWYKTNANFKTREVGKLAANTKDLFDMSGNVQEWCWDWRGILASTTPVTGPATGTERVLRGGNSGSDTGSTCECYVITRISAAPSLVSSQTGFRVVRKP